MRLFWTAFAIMPLAFAATASQPLAPVCGTRGNANICLASVDAQMKVKPELRTRLAEAGTRAIDVISSPAFEAELLAFHTRYDATAGDAEHKQHWRDFDPAKAVSQTRASFDGLHVMTIGGLRSLFSATFAGNLAYEGSTRADGSREVLLNRNRLDRPVADLAATYVHEAAHKAGYSHRGRQNALQKCESPYVMGQIAEKLIDPASWPSKLNSADVCPFFKKLGS